MSRYEQHVEKKGLWWPIVVAIILVLIAVIWGAFLLNHQDKEPEIKIIELPKESPVSTLAEKAGEEKGNIEDTKLNSASPVFVRKNKEFNEQLVLPELEASDTLFKQQMSLVSVKLLAWLEVGNMIEKYMLIINDLSQNQILFKHAAFLQRPSQMVVGKDAKGFYLTSNSYKRYDGLADAIVAIDIKQAIQLYLKFKPLFERVYKGFSYPKNYQLQDVFVKAAANIIAAPIIENRIALLPYEKRYKFADKSLEQLNNVEKQMIRMGPENSRKIQATLRKLVQALTVLPE